MIRKIIFSLFLLTGTAHAQQAMDDVTITTEKVSDGIYMLQGRGGNIGLSVGDDGVFMIDDQFAPLTDKIVAAIHRLSDKPIRFLINTHHHFDHTGGNENLGKKNVNIVAHDNVYKRLSNELAEKRLAEKKKGENPPSDAGLPVISFNDEMTFHLNGLHIRAVHFEHAHTDGDSVIYFEDKNVLHMGDTFFNGMYPFIDTTSGGSVYGVLDVVAHTLKSIDDQTKIIPGHGPLAHKADLKIYDDMLRDVVSILEELAKKGLSVEDVVKLKPLAKYDEKYSWSFITAEKFLNIVYKDIYEHKHK